MDQDCSAGLSLVLAIGNATATREKDEMYVSQKKVNGPPLQLDLFPLDRDSRRGTSPWEKTSPSIGTGSVGSERSTAEAMVPIHHVAVSWRSDANKCPASCFSNEDAGGIDVSLSKDSNAINLGNGYAKIKRRRQDDGEELENDRVWSRVLSDPEEEGCSRKKLRLSREQCAVLVESFRKNRVPEPKEKQALALKLNLRPRQVEVWFQNRRARTKLKKTEMDSEVLKRYNETLADENRKLRIELEKLKALKMSPPLRPASSLTMCPSCERVSVGDNSSHLTLAKSGSMFLRSSFLQ